MEEFIRVKNMSGGPLPKMLKDDVYDMPPRWDGKDFPFEKGQSRILPVNVAKHISKQQGRVVIETKDGGKERVMVLKIDSKPVDINKLLLMVKKDRKALDTFIDAEGDVLINLDVRPHRTAEGENILQGDSRAETVAPADPNAVIPIHQAS